MADIDGAGGSAATMAFLRAYDDAIKAHRVTPVGSTGTSVTVDDTGAVSVYGQSKLSTVNSFNQNVSNGAFAIGQVEACDGYEQISCLISCDAGSSVSVSIQFFDDSGGLAPVASDGGFFQGFDVYRAYKVRGSYFKVTVFNNSGGVASIIVKTRLWRIGSSPDTSFSTNSFYSGTELHGKIPFWAYTDATFGYGPLVTSDGAPFPIQIGNAINEGSNLASYAVTRSATNVTLSAQDYGLLTSNRNYGWDGGAWRRANVDTSGNTVVSGTVTANVASVTLSAATLNNYGVVSAMSSSYVTFLTIPSAAVILQADNGTNQMVELTGDGGSTTLALFDTRQSKTWDLGANFRKIAGPFQVRHTGTAPTAGSFRLSVVL